MNSSLKNWIFLILILILSGTKSYAQVYELGNTDNNYAWFKLGVLTLPQGGADAEIRIISGNGYNASQVQQGECTIHFRTSNGVSENNGFFGSGSFYCTGRARVVSNIRVVQLSQYSWTFYGFLTGYTGVSAILNFTKASAAGQWQPGLELAVPPAGVSSDLIEEAAVLSNTFFNANVGIGTYDPQAKLAVNGLIRTKEVKVETTNFPDYVFNPAYDLRTLDEVKTYINHYHRLPEMPSEKEVINEGMNLGEINKLLVKKVEELTLYLLQKDDELKSQIDFNERQKEANFAQQVLNNQLENRLKKLEGRIQK